MVNPVKVSLVRANQIRAIPCGVDRVNIMAVTSSMESSTTATTINFGTNFGTNRENPLFF